MENKRKYLRRLIIETFTLNVLILILLGVLFIRESQKSDGIWLEPFIILTLLIMGVIGLLFLLGKNINQNNSEEDQRVENVREKADLLTREIVGNITHDLKTPLTAIKGYSQGILDGVASTPEQMNKYVFTIRNKANDMAVLVDELSFFTQIYQNNTQYNLQEVNVNDYLSECVSDLSFDLEMKKISLVYQNVTDKNLQIRIDKEKIKRVINNIIGNSLKYINSETGIVFIHAKETKEDVIVQITDNGVGIEQEELPFIFERFYRTDDSRNSKTGGTGLGLAIAKKIIEDHKGKIWAESEFGKGTRISFSLPKM